MNILKFHNMFSYNRNYIFLNTFFKIVWLHLMIGKALIFFSNVQCAPQKVVVRTLCANGSRPEHHSELTTIILDILSPVPMDLPLVPSALVIQSSTNTFEYVWPGKLALLPMFPTILVIPKHTTNTTLKSTHFIVSSKILFFYNKKWSNTLTPAIHIFVYVYHNQIVCDV